jgi:N-acetylglucosaminyl-diphospho-decaprenol L-rhamnosyltransferase
VHDLAIITISTNEAQWLPPCLTSVFEHAGGASLDVIVADNQSTDGTRELVEGQFPHARVITCENRGFSHANNQAAMATDAGYVLFLNPDTEIVEGTFGELVRALDARPEVGLVGVKQVTAEGELWPTIRRFPNAVRMFFESIGSERFPFRASFLGERELDLARYEEEVSCDWTSGSFMLVRREALLAAGLMDERSFIYSEEPDLCLRIKQAGWDVRHLPTMTIVHHAGKAGLSARMLAQDAYSRVLYARKHFGRLHRLTYLGAIAFGLLLRALATKDRERRSAFMGALSTLAGRREPPFGQPQGVAVAPPDTVARGDTASEKTVTDAAA